MRDERADSRIYFHHIPKTAGTSLRDFLTATVGAVNVAPILRSGRFRDALRDYAGFAVITGHLEILPGDALPTDRVSITLLREPVDRVLSNFYYQRNVYKAGRRGAEGSNVGLSNWLATLEDDGSSDGLNGQVASLWPLGWTPGSIPTAAERVIAAARALDAFDVVGLQSSMSESLALIAYRMGWSPPDDVPHANRTLGRPSITDLPATIAHRLQRILGPDLEVYDYARSLFAKQLLRALRAAASARAAGVAGTQLGANRRSEPVDDCTAYEPPSGGAADAPVGDRIEVISDEPHTRAIRIENVAIKGEISEAEYLQVGERAMLTLRVATTIPVSDLNIGFAIRDDVGALVFATNTRALGDAISLTSGTYAAVFSLANQLGVGHYWVSASLHNGNSYLHGCVDAADKACQFEVVDRLTGYFEGRLRLHVDVKVIPVDHGGRVDVVPVDAAGHERLALLAHRNPALSEFSARLTPLASLSGMPRAADAMLHIAITNTGSVAWSVFGKRAVAVSYHWLDATGKILVFDGLRTNLPYDIRPGERIELPCFLRAPEASGPMTLVWTLVQEDVAWFNDRNPASCLACQVEIA